MEEYRGMEDDPIR